MANAKTNGAAAPAPAGPSAPSAKKARLLQEDVPSYSLDQALRVARSIGDNYGYKPTKPVNVAGAMGMTHTSGPFRAISGAAVAYGLTTGGAQGAEIGITPLGMRIIRPTTVGDDMAAKREALLKPRVIGEFLRDYDSAALPPEAIAKNVLLSKGVPADRLDSVLELIVESGRAVGFIRDWGGGKRTVDLAGPLPAAEAGDAEAAPESASAMPMARHAAPTPSPVVSVGQGIHINIEIHIAADASSETVEDIFKNMRRYVLSGDGQADDGPTDAE